MHLTHDPDQTRALTVRLPKADHDALARLANRAHRTLSGQIRWLIAQEAARDSEAA